MIEFKADCGHTVRAKDEDAGGVVRCSYCGREATVPDQHGDGLDFLFTDIEPQEAEPAKRRRRRRARPKRIRPPGSFNPFSVVLRLCYAALLITIVIVVGRKWVLPLFKEDGLASQIVKKRQEEAPKPDPPPAPTSTRTAQPGLIDRGQLAGLYVSSTPPGALAFCIETSKAPASGRIHQIRGVTRFRADADHPQLSDGEYVVEVVFPWNDRSLTAYDGYTTFRRSIQNGSFDQRVRLLEEYFVPDEASDVFVDQTEEQLYLVRQYRNADVRDKRSEGVRALFLPKLAADGTGISVSALLAGQYIPAVEAYAFDEDYVKGELEYYEVPGADQRFIIESLRRIGTVPYVTRDGNTRLFKIGIHDGWFSAKVIRELTP